MAGAQDDPFFPTAIRHWNNWANPAHHHRETCGLPAHLQKRCEIRQMMQVSLTAEERQLCQQVGYWGTSWHPTLLRLHSQESKSKWARTLTGQHPYTKWHFLIAGPGILAHWPEDEGWAIAPAVWQPASQLPLPVWVCVSFSVTEQSSQAVISF